MMWSVNSTYSAIRRVSRSAITDGPKGRRCVDTPILGTLRHSCTSPNHQPTNTHQRSRTPKIQRPGQVPAARMLASSQWRVTGEPMQRAVSGEPSMTEGDDRLVDRDTFAGSLGELR